MAVPLWRYEPPAASRSRHRTGVPARLLALVLVPVVVTALFAGVVLSDRHDAANQAITIRRAITDVDALVGLEEALHNEQAGTQILLRAATFHLTATQVATLLGFPIAKVDRSRVETDRTLARLVRMRPFTSASLNRLRAGIDSKRLSPSFANDGYDGLDRATATALQSSFRDLEDRASNIAGSADLRAALQALGASSDAMRYGAAQVSDLADILLSGASAGASGEVALGHDSGLYQEAGSRLAGAPAAVALEWRTLRENSGVETFETAVRSQADATPARAGRTTNITELLAPLGGGFVRDDMLYRLIQTASKNVRTTADKLRDGLTASYRLWAIAVVTLLGGIVGVALLLVRSMTRPLKRLAANAKAVSMGRLDVDVLPLQGPRETAVVQEAFNDLVSNLKLLEAKSRALADYDLDNPILAEPLPGRLGRAIQDSVQVLSGSIEEREALQQRLAHQATHDALTGMYNRASALSVLDQALARAARHAVAVAVLFVDLDDFKRVNDTHGHEVGDHVLCAVADRLHLAIRGGDLAARLGGDEFVVIAEEVADGAEATALARRIVDAIREPIAVNNLHFSVGASVGVALALDGEADASQLLARSDLALYRAKQGGRSRIEMYDEALQQELVHQSTIEEELGAALQRDGDLVLYYQPVVDTSTGVTTGVEALVRWNRDGRLVPPDEFIPVAEASDLIIDVDTWVLATATRQLAAWAADPVLGGMTIAVNISGRHLLSQSLEGHVREAIDASGADPHRLILEVTETVLLRDFVVAATQLEAVQRLGVRVYIDDFGTGYTSIAHLHHLPVNAIKIDRSFVSQMHHPHDHSLIRMITDLGHQLGIGIVAEGVETPPQRHALRELGCDELQGYLISRPVPAAEFVTWMHRAVDEAS